MIQIDQSLDKTDTPGLSLDRSILGFSNNLKARLKESRAELDRFVADQKQKADAARALHAEFLQTERIHVQTMIRKLKEIQTERGILDEEVSTVGSDVAGANIVRKSAEVRRLQAEAEKELKSLNLANSGMQRKVLGEKHRTLVKYSGIFLLRPSIHIHLDDSNALYFSCVRSRSIKNGTHRTCKGRKSKESQGTCGGIKKVDGRRFDLRYTQIQKIGFGFRQSGR